MLTSMATPERILRVRPRTVLGVLGPRPARRGPGVSRLLELADHHVDPDRAVSRDGFQPGGRVLRAAGDAARLRRADRARPGGRRDRGLPLPRAAAAHRPDRGVRRRRSRAGAGAHPRRRPARVPRARLPDRRADPRGAPGSWPRKRPRSDDAGALDRAERRNGGGRRRRDRLPHAVHAHRRPTSAPVDRRTSSPRARGPAGSAWLMASTRRSGATSRATC